MDNNNENQELISTEARYQIEQYKAKTANVVGFVKGLKIETRDEAEQALDLAVEAINLREKIEEKRKEIIEPSRKFQSEINRLAKEFTESLDEVKETIVETFDDWKLRSSEGREFATSKVQTSESVEMSFDVSDMAAIPREFLVVNETMVKLMIKQGVRIPGLEIHKKTKTTLRRR